MEASQRSIEVAAATDRPDTPRAVDRLGTIAVRGLTSMNKHGITLFPHTARRGPGGAGLTFEGYSARYSAIVALGAGRLAVDVQRAILDGETARRLVERAGARALAGTDPGAVALAAWAATEVGADDAGPLLQRLAYFIRSDRPAYTVDLAWALTALTAARDVVGIGELADRTAERLVAGQGGRGIFPHMLPASTASRLRAHVGCYADQVYPIQALARYAAAKGADRMLDAANRCAQRICQLQGPSGQWWWHYDARTGDVVEGYPVYSVHQHAMGPMALLELHEVGGLDCRSAVAAGLSWIEQPAETGQPLVAEELGVIWRKIGRREPRKAVRRIRSVTTALRPGLRLSWLDRACPPGPVDYECRPYELGWLLYAWWSAGVSTRAPTSTAASSRHGATTGDSPRA